MTIRECDTIQDTHISIIRSGDTVLHNGKVITVCNNDIKSGFMGITLFGDSYRSGRVPVKKVIIFHAKPDLSKLNLQAS